MFGYFASILMERKVLASFNASLVAINGHLRTRKYIRNRIARIVSQEHFRGLCGQAILMLFYIIYNTRNVIKKNAQAHEGEK